jgi:hypothetical protein
MTTATRTDEWDDGTCEKWRQVWRRGMAPSLGTDALEFLAGLLESDDGCVTQGSTTTPPPLMCVQDWPVEAACPLATCGAFESGGFREASVGACEEYFARVCFDCDQRLESPAACRWFLNWWDDTPRDTARAELLAEVKLVLAERAAKPAA